MKKLANDSSAISEIVGALMLVLIVVIAASSFAIFISQQQKIQQDNQLIKDQKAGESLLISSLRTNATTDGEYWSSLNITVSSLDQGSSQIDRLSINGYPLKSFHVERLNATTNKVDYEQMNYSQMFIIPSQQIVNINVSQSDFFGSVKLRVDSSIEYELFTAYSNEFEKIFYPPTAIISVDTESQWNSSALNYTPFLILDGSQSDQPGDSTIAAWNWTISWGTNVAIASSPPLVETLNTNPNSTTEVFTLSTPTSTTPFNLAFGGDIYTITPTSATDAGLMNGLNNGMPSTGSPKWIQTNAENSAKNGVIVTASNNTVSEHTVVTVTPIILHTEESGRKVRFDPPESGTYYTITLMVENGNGLIGRASTTYFH
jgi:flagellin-like protein